MRTGRLGSFAYPATCGKSISANRICDRSEAMSYIADTYMGNDARSRYCGACLQLLRLEQIKEES